MTYTAIARELYLRKITKRLLNAETIRLIEKGALRKLRASKAIQALREEARRALR